MLKVCGLTKRYGKSTAIEDISFHVKTGEIVGLIGHNGCGKSTTMNIVTGYLAASEGNVFVDGENSVECAKSVRKKIGYLPETPPLYLEMTVEEQLSFACDLKGIKHRKDAIRQACKQADLKNVGGRLLRNLSKGYRQRIGLAQAFLGEPPLLILDEPSSGLDPYQNAEMRDILREAAKKQSILLSSHVLTEVSAVCNRIIAMSNGKLVADDTPAALRHRYSESNHFYIIAAGSSIEFQKKAMEASVCKIKIDEKNGNGTFRAEFMMNGTDPAAAVMSILLKAGCQLLQFGPVLLELENVYFNLTKDKRYETEAR